MEAISLTPTALSPALPSELLTYILTHQTYPTTLIICQPRADFLGSLLKAINHTSPPQFHASQEVLSSPAPDDSTVLLEPPPERHPLLIPTLHQIATSRHVNLVFISTVTHLRAYLAVFPTSSIKAEPPNQKFDKPGKKVPLLVMYGLVGLHRDTSEWSAQGLGNSLSSLVEAGRRASRKVVLMEEKTIGVGTDLGEGAAEGEESKKVISKIWDERVPMLNGSARRAGLESEDGGWSGRTVEVGRILSRWFKFQKGDWDSN
jgi:hypothetical protein